ncbi:hypothetical protein Btru_016423 [Bulinus truncatus]|nr:hypothetical protein Btru_016423 [Bulinus truncatus]
MIVKYPTSFEDGAPFSTCLTRYPKHGAAAQTKAHPYTFTLNPTAYSANGAVQITISGDKIKGIQMAAFLANGVSEEAFGQFSNLGSKLKAFTCFGEMKDNMVTHSHDHGVTSLTFTWTAPNRNVGNIVFKTTIVRDYEEFWVDISTPLNGPAGPVDQGNLYDKIINPTSLTKDIDFSACGNTKGDDETVICIGRSSKLSIQHSYNPDYNNDRQLTRSISEVEVKDADGRIQCRLCFQKQPTYTLSTKMLQILSIQTKPLTHSNDWYLQLAWGNVLSDSDVISQHEIMPPVSFDKISLKDKSIFRGSPYGYLVRAHVSLMLIGWLLITGITTVISRHYRNWLPEKKIMGTKVWFQVHRALAILVVLLTALGLVMVFAEYGAEIREGSIPHSVIGLIVTGFVALQIIAGFLRPNPDHNRRIFFNWGHRILGQLTHILAAVTLFLGFGMEQNIQEMKTFGLIVIGIWFAGQIGWHIVFEILSRPGKPLNETDAQGDTEKSKKNKTSKLLTILLSVYGIFLVALCVAAMAAFLLY